MPQTDIVNAFTKGSNWGHFAVPLVEKPFDKETRVRSDVCGRGEEKLDPTIIEYARISDHLIHITFYLGR